MNKSSYMNFEVVTDENKVYNEKDCWSRGTAQDEGLQLVC